MKRPFYPKYLPVNIPLESLLEILKIETDARVKIERYNSILERSPIREEIFLMFSLDESLQSTRIEGTQATFDEVISSEITGDKRVDIIEVRNYLEALTQGVELLKIFPISTRILLELHKIILSNARGENRNPGEYRKVQNFIGPTSRIEDATYIPPEANLLPDYITNLEKYINDDSMDNRLGYLVKAAIIHAQFETIHPFLDGNGRMGRILIILYLLDKGVVNKPTFYISQELERNKYKYYNLLNNLRNENPNWLEWIKFFLNCSILQADHYINKLEKIEKLYEEMLEITEKYNIRIDVVKSIFKSPVFDISSIKKKLGISYNTVRNNVDKLIKSGKIYPDDKKRNKTYRFYDLLDIMR
ncbi:MAG: Fic family protein [Tissierellia bacterium]|nr:Fic family protein [Tissierellia bacterium]